ncbi:RNA polymerase sigma factor (TIGR02999 family) [Haloferula luteola]|uniref:RNA polymerase sigma factor (TIGR02999 family) n=1 Tax=Haloferula luteola TaxID=595692 RepID=A0A840UXR7_9BACT|nr:ECF-type sigma factor [Haloferula luteola]MBB5350572.1 RNA polymerase sigma factor (TIGR02999 family) [Haloferula luteola]
MSEIERILEKASGDRLQVSEELLPLVYDELRTLAAQRLAGQAPGQTLQATALVHEAWLRLTHHSDRKWNDRTHFFRAAALAMRHILVNRARGKATLKRGENAHCVSLEGLEVADTGAEDRILEVDAALTVLEKEDPDSARVVTLKFFGGLTNKEIAAMENVTERTIERKWAYARNRLYQLICDEL